MRNRLVLAGLLGLVLGAANGAEATASFGRVRPVDPVAAANDTSSLTYRDDAPVVAGDGAGNWVALWHSIDPTAGVILDPGGLGDIVVSRSSDGAETWSAPVVIDDEAATRSAYYASIATDKNGVWVAAWADVFDSMRVSRSTDGGATWSAAQSLASGFFGEPVVSVDGAGNWLVTWVDPDSDGWLLQVARSTDGGQTWSAPISAFEDPSESSSHHRVAAGSLSDWVIVFEYHSSIVAISSLDGGLTWSSPVELGVGNVFDATRSDIATDDAGRWIAIWDVDLPVAGEAPDDDDDDVVYAISTDVGAAWSTPLPIQGAAAAATGGSTFRTRIAYDGHGAWHAVWDESYDSLGGAIGLEGDIVQARSLDGGLTWTDPSALNANAGHDNVPPDADINYDGVSAITFDGNGVAVAVWTSTGTLDGTIGDDTDNDIFYATSVDDCPLSPASGCRLPTRPGAARLDLKNPIGGKDKLRWRWSAGEETTLADLGDPTVSSGYVLCLYDKAAGTLRNVFEIDSPPASDCRGVACWSPMASGFRYADRSQQNGPVRSLKLVAGSAGRASADLKASGPTVAPPVMPLAVDPSVRVQLLNTENGNCWEAVFSTPVVNTATRFKARSD